MKPRRRKSIVLSAREVELIDELAAGLLRRHMRVEAASALAGQPLPYPEWFIDERLMRHYLEQPLRKMIRNVRSFEKGLGIEPEE